MINVNKITSEIIPLADLMDKDGNFKTDTSAEQYPMMVDIQLEILKNDIEINGQLLPILIWRGMIVDGRNRCRSLKELGVSDVTVRKLPHKMTEEDRMDLAKNIENTRRHETPTQLACSAVREYYRSKASDKKTTVAMIVKKFPIAMTNFKVAKWLYDNHKVDFELLFDGKGLQLDKGKKLTTSLTAVKHHRQAQAKMNEFLNSKCEEDVEEVENEEYVAMVTFARTIAGLVKQNRDLFNYDLNEFAEVLLDTMSSEYKHKVIATLVEGS